MKTPMNRTGKPDRMRLGGRVLFLAGLLGLGVVCVSVSAADPVAAEEKEAAKPVAVDPVPADPALMEAAGRAALDDGLYALAEKHFRALLSQPGLDSEATRSAVLSLARTLHGQGEHDAALAALDETQPWLKQVEDTGGFLYWRAMAHFGKGDDNTALNLLRTLDEQFPESDHRRPAERLATRIHLDRNRLAEALSAFERFDRLAGTDEDTAANLLDWGRTLVQARRNDDAETILRRLIVMQVGAASVLGEAHYWLGRAHMGAQRWTDALAALTASAEARDADDDLAGRAYFAQASVYTALTNAPGALAALSNGIARARSPEVKRLGRAHLGVTLLEQDRIETARPLIKAYVTEAPQAPEASVLQLLLAEALLNHGRSQEAADEFQRYLEAFSDPAGQAQATRGRGWALYNAGHYAESATTFLKALTLSQDSGFRSQALFKAGDAYLANGQYERAAEIYARVIEAHPDSALVPQAMFQRGQSLARAGKTEESQALFLDLHQRHPNSPVAEKALFRTAELMESQNRPDEAIEAFSRVIATYAEGALTADALLARGLLRYRQFATREALADFETLIRDFPQTEAGERAFYMRGLCHYRLLRDQDMLDILNAFLKRYPESVWAPQAMFRLAQYFHNQENYAEAEAKFLALAETFKDHALADQALLRAGHAAAKRKEYLQAIARFVGVAKTYPESRWLAEARFGHAEALRQLGRYSEAILFYDELRTRHPASDLVPTAWMRRGDAQFMLGVEDARRYREALQSYRAVAGDPGAYRTQPALVYEAEYKIGRCLEKLNQPDDALEQYYTKVMVRFLHEMEKGVRHDDATRRWFERASMNAVDILESRKDWRRVVAVLERSLDAGVSSGEDVRKRINKIRSEHFWLFY